MYGGTSSELVSADEGMPPTSAHRNAGPDAPGPQHMSADHPEAAQTSPNAALDDRGRSPDSSATGREISLGGGMGMGSSLSSSRTTSPSPQSPERRGGGGATLGASLFSFPPSQAPSTGVYSMPMEAFEFRDLDSGRVFSLDERYWIKDVDTGNVYVVQPQDADGAGGAPGQGGVANARGGTGSVGGQMSMRVSDLLSGEELTLEQFEEALGYFKVPPPVPPPLPPPEEDPDMLAAAQHLAQRSLHSLSLAAQASASWIKGKAAAAMGRQSPTRHSDMASWGSGLGPSSPTASSVNMPATDGQGIPVKVSVARKPFKELSDLRLVQQVAAHQGVIWAMRFSRTGRYLATAGQDGVVAVWEVVQRRGESTTPRSATAAAAGASSAGEESQPASPLRGGSTAASSVAGEEEKFGSGSVSPVGSGSGESGSGNATYGVPVLRGRPYRVYHGHKQDILDVAWSKTNFLLSASMDKTVRLWHVSMDDCLRIFKHSDFVTAIDFHPSDDKIFISGSIDGKVRLWNIPEQRVVSWQDVHDMVTAVGYSRDGKKAVVGTMRGKCRFYSVGGDRGGLEYEAQLDVKNTRGQHARGKKVTGVNYMPGKDLSTSSLLITSNDSRVRLYDGYTLRAKYKGHANKSTQIKASFSPRGDYVICGSDDGAVYIWSTRKASLPGSPERSTSSTQAASRSSHLSSEAPPTGEDPATAKEKNASYESFQAAGDVVTVALFAPESTHRSLESFSPMAATATAAVAAAAALGGSGSSGRDATMAVAGSARGQVIVTAGYGGEIKVYENVGLPQWM